MDDDVIISRIYEYKLTNPIQFSVNIPNIKVLQYDIQLINDGQTINGFQIKIDNLDKDDARIESDGIANIFLNEISVRTFPPRIVKCEPIKIINIHQYGQKTYTIYKTITIRYNIEASTAIINNSGLNSIGNDNSKNELLKKYKHASQSYGKDYFQTYRDLYLMIENNNIIDPVDKKMYKIVRHLLSHDKLNDSTALYELGLLIKKYPFDFINYHYVKGDNSNIAAFDFNSQNNQQLIKQLVDEIIGKIQKQLLK